MPDRTADRLVAGLARERLVAGTTLGMFFVVAAHVLQATTGGKPFSARGGWRDIGRTEHSLWNEWSMGPTVGEFHPVQGVASNDGEPLCESNATLT